jgi:hypothetical protein
MKKLNLFEVKWVSNVIFDKIKGNRDIDSDKYSEIINEVILISENEEINVNEIIDKVIEKFK